MKTTILFILLLLLSLPIACNQNLVKDNKYFVYNEENEIVKASCMIEQNQLKVEPHIPSADTTQHKIIDFSSDGRAKIIMQEFEHFIKIAAFIKLYKTEQHHNFFIMAFDYTPTTHKLDVILFFDSSDGFVLVDVHRITYLNGKYILYSYKPIQDKFTSFQINYTAYYQFIETGSSAPYLK